MTRIQPVILAGGVGSRLWPLSRELYPKQLLQLVGNQSLLQATFTRVLKLDNILPPILVVGEEHRFITKSQIDDLEGPNKTTIILEPLGRNTAPAISAAAYYVEQEVAVNFLDDSIVMLVLPADHLIQNEKAFSEAVSEAAKLVNDGKIVTFGIIPQSPETGYGYIQKGAGSEVISFVEKPDSTTAQKYLNSGNYFWNSGMFAFSAKVFNEEMLKYAPEICTAMDESVKKGTHDGDFFRIDMESMAQSPSDSIDYALMEKSANVAVVPADLAWCDIGSWQALWCVSEKDASGNVASGDIILEDVSNSLIRSQKTLVTAIGLEGMMVVETGDAVLVAPLDRSQDVKKIVTRLKKDQREEYKLHTTVYRPWGSYTILEEQEKFKIKRITVNQNEKLSLQMHHHRSEHWIVVKGTAKVTCGEKEFLVLENQSTYIPCGETHRLENPGVIPLELIEVQNGAYLGEDDIVRFDDVYGREK